MRWSAIIGAAGVALIAGVVILAMSGPGRAGTSADGSVDRLLAETWVAMEMAPQPAKPVALWRAAPSSMLCGEIAAPPPLREQRSTLRYVYDAATKVSQVEYHQGWRGAGRLSEAALEANRRAFDQLWRDQCAPNAPWSRRIAAMVTN